MKHEFHNPDNLTPEQVGDGYRLLLPSEIKDRPLTHEIHCWFPRNKRWFGGVRWNGNNKECTYRVPLATWPLPPEDEPWTLGNSVNDFTLGEGQKWHRNDWTKDMLPEGWRPLLLGEVNQDKDEGFSIREEMFKILTRNKIPAAKEHTHLRTRRPLPAPEIPWTEWHGGACPLNDEEVDVWEYRMLDGFTCDSPGKPSCYAPHWEHKNVENNIIAYRVLKWKAKTPALAKYVEVESLPPVETFPAAMEAVTKQEATPTDNDAWESLLHNNANLKCEVLELKKQRDALMAEYESVIHVCQGGGYDPKDSIVEWLERLVVDRDLAEFENWWAEQARDGNMPPCGTATALRIWKAARREV